MHLQVILCEGNGSETFLKVSFFLSGRLDFKHSSISRFYSFAYISPRVRLQLASSFQDETDPFFTFKLVVITFNSWKIFHQLNMKMFIDEWNNDKILQAQNLLKDFFEIATVWIDWTDS